MILDGVIVPITVYSLMAHDQILKVTLGLCDHAK